MKKKKGFELRHLLRENVIISKGKENIDFNKIRNRGKKDDAGDEVEYNFSV